MIGSGKISLNENQIQLLQSSIENLHSIKDWGLLTEAIVIEGIRLVGGGKGIFFVYDQSLKQLIPQKSLNLNKIEKKEIIGITQRLFRKKSYQTSKSFMENTTYYFPITRQKTFTGVLAIIPQQEEHLSAKQMNMLTIFMQSVPIILENSRLFLMMQRKTESLTYMNQLHKLIKHYSFQEILVEIVQKVGELLQSEMAGIMLYDPDHKELRLQKPAFGNWKDEVIDQYRVSMTYKSNAKDVFLTGAPAITVDAQNDERYSQRFVNLFAAKSIITVPLLVDNQRIGVLHAINKKDGYFTQDDLNLLDEMSEQLGLIINAALETTSTGASKTKRIEIEGYLVSQLFDYLLNSDKEKIKEANNIMKTLGIKVESRVCVIKIGAYKDGEWKKQFIKDHSKSIIAKIERILQTTCSIYKDGNIVVLFPHTFEEEINNRCVVLQKELQKQLNLEAENNKPALDIVIGIGKSVELIESISQSYQQASQILNVLPRIQHLGNIGYYPACGSWTLLSSMALIDHNFVSGYSDLYLNEINKIKDSKEMKETLEVYLKHNGQIKKTAEALFIHQNTLKYRIEKISDLTGFDLTDSEVRLNLTLALRLEHLLYKESIIEMTT